MNEFQALVEEQMKTMDHLLYLQSEVERCHELQNELSRLRSTTTVSDIHCEIEKMNNELNEIVALFEQQTDEVVKLFRKQNIKNAKIIV
ncbi:MULTISPECIES: YgaB family protein [Cytobacillus]|uniref:YgaB-like protein n=1 Tax=Cytobacillus stercorigallinarum TaxID=2762240 RepID=A0ABR8QVI9_9BACI|nr:YgaB family protein [Cytobacillus stercorigallinarum]MBD7939508.1 hypothetical protein [Cytobacillus stercorigallinarum]